MRKTLLTTITLLSMYLAISPVSEAAVSCQPIYGGGQTCVTTGNLLISKQVLNPKTNQMVETLNFNDPRYKPEDIVSFKIVVTNSGGTALQNIQIQDTLPSFLSFIGSSTGNFDANTKKLSYSVGNLNPNESNTVTFQARIVSANLPGDPVICQNNIAFAAVDNNIQQDNAQFCVEKPIVAQPTAQPQAITQPAQPAVTKGGKVVFPAPSVSKTPPTGPEALPLLALIPTGLFGYILRKSSIGRSSFGRKAILQ